MKKFVPFLVLAAVAGAALLGGRPLHAAPAQPAAFALSPEEAVLGLLPYQLTGQTLPPGYAIASLAADTAVTRAALSSDPASEFAAETRAGYVVGAIQTLRRRGAPGQAAKPDADFRVILFADAASARAYAAGQALPVPPEFASADRIEPADLGATFGDTSSASHAIINLPTGQSLSRYYVRWQRGQLVFRVSTTAPAGQERLPDATDLVSLLDARLVTLPAPVFGAPTVQPPATEAQRFRALTSLRTLAIPSGQLPPGYGAAGSSVGHPADMVITDSDPVTALHNADEQLRRVVSTEQNFTGVRDRAASVMVNAIVDADPPAAHADASVYPLGAGETASPTDAPVQLGDTTVATHITGTNGDGTAYEAEDLAWTHGNIVLDVQLEAEPGAVSQADLLAFAQALDALYQASFLAIGG